MASVILTPTLARRLAISRQRLADPQSASIPDGMMEVFRNLGYIQIDPIRAVERTQLLVLWSRLGNYDQTHLDTLLWEERQLFEYWAHAASIVLTENYPLHQLQMRLFARNSKKWSQRVRAWLDENEPFRQHVLDRLRREGPLAADEIEDLAIRPWQSSGWTNGRSITLMLSFLWEQGDIMVANRNGLHRKWTLTEEHLPEWANQEPLPEDEVVRRAAQTSLRALGIATAKQIGTHFIKGHYNNLKTVLADLVAEKRVIPVTIISEGETAWPGEWYIHTEDLPLLERLTAGEWQPRTTLLSPFDNLIIDRDRTELMWDFYYRMEIYVPKAKREYGYYVLPILHGDRLVGRIDPKMDRKSGKLHINAIYTEPNAPQDTATAQAIAGAIADLALFLEAKEIVYGEKVPAGWQLS